MNQKQLATLAKTLTSQLDTLENMNKAADRRIDYLIGQYGKLHDDQRAYDIVQRLRAGQEALAATITNLGIAESAAIHLAKNIPSGKSVTRMKKARKRLL